MAFQQTYQINKIWSYYNTVKVSGVLCLDGKSGKQDETLEKREDLLYYDGDPPITGS